MSMKKFLTTAVLGLLISSPVHAACRAGGDLFHIGVQLNQLQVTPGYERTTQVEYQGAWAKKAGTVIGLLPNPPINSMTKTSLEHHAMLFIALVNPDKDGVFLMWFDEELCLMHHSAMTRQRWEETVLPKMQDSF
jgi:hypothetical protein